MAFIFEAVVACVCQCVTNQSCPIPCIVRIRGPPPFPHGQLMKTSNATPPRRPKTSMPNAKKSFRCRPAQRSSIIYWEVGFHRRGGVSFFCVIRVGPCIPLNALPFEYYMKLNTRTQVGLKPARSPKSSANFAAAKHKFGAFLVFVAVVQRELQRLFHNCFERRLQFYSIVFLRCLHLPFIFLATPCVSPARCLAIRYDPLSVK